MRLNFFLFVRLNGFFDSDFENNTVCRNTEIVAGSYVRDDELLESLHFFEKLDSSDTFKNRTKSSKNIATIVQLVDELTVFFKI